MVNDIAVTIIQPIPPFYNLVDKAGGWREDLGTHYVQIGGSGTGGTLRFVCPDNGQTFAISLGVHNSNLWGDIVTGSSQSAKDVISSYYETNWGGTGDTARVAARWATRTTGAAIYGGRTISFTLTPNGADAKLELKIVP